VIVFNCPTVEKHSIIDKCKFLRKHVYGKYMMLDNLCVLHVKFTEMWTGHATQKAQA